MKGHIPSIVFISFAMGCVVMLVADNLMFSHPGVRDKLPRSVEPQFIESTDPATVRIEDTCVWDLNNNHRFEGSATENAYKTTYNKVKQHKYINKPQSHDYIRFLYERNLSNGLEIGFLKGKSSVLVATALKLMDPPGHLTSVDKHSAADYKDGTIFELMNLTDTNEFIEVNLVDDYLMWFQQFLKDGPPMYDFVYLDADHMWLGDGYGFFLCMMVLKPCGWIIFDDVWSAFPEVEAIISELVARHPQIDCFMRAIHNNGQVYAHKDCNAKDKKIPNIPPGRVKEHNLGKNLEDFVVENI